MEILLVIAAIWLIAASFTDLRNTEVANWLSFSLLSIALTVRIAESVIAWNIEPLNSSLLGLAIFFIIANLLYYGKVFAGGDAKLLIALGPIIPGTAFLSNLLIVGSIYGIIYTLALAMINPKPVWSEIKKQKHNSPYLFIFLAVFIAIGIAFNMILIYLLSSVGILLYGIHIFVRSVENTCLIKKVSPKNLNEGDWLYKGVKIHGETIKAGFQGLTMKQIRMLKRANKTVKIKYGIPFIPVFLIAFLITVFWKNIFSFSL